jgi:hypothetical protein
MITFRGYIVTLVIQRNYDALERSRNALLYLTHVQMNYNNEPNTRYAQNENIIKVVHLPHDLKY